MYKTDSFNFVTLCSPSGFATEQMRKLKSGVEESKFPSILPDYLVPFWESVKKCSTENPVEMCSFSHFIIFQ